MKDVNAYLHGKLIAKNLLKLALSQNKMLADVKNELRSHYPSIEFKIVGKGGDK